MSTTTFILIGVIIFVFLLDFIIRKRKKNNLVIETQFDQNSDSYFERNVLFGVFSFIVFLFIGFINIDLIDEKWNNFFIENEIVEEKVKDKIKDKPVYLVDNDLVNELFEFLRSSNAFSSIDEFTSFLDEADGSGLEDLYELVSDKDYLFKEEFINYFNKNANLLVPEIEYYGSKKIDAKKAIVALSKQILLDPNNDKLYYNRGLYKKNYPLYQNLAAITDFSKAIKLKPGISEYYLNRGESNRFYFYTGPSLNLKITIQRQDRTSTEYEVSEWDYTGDRFEQLEIVFKNKYSDYGVSYLNSYDFINPNQNYYNNLIRKIKAYRPPSLNRNGNYIHRYKPGTKTFTQQALEFLKPIRKQKLERKKYYYSAKADLEKAFKMNPESSEIALSLASFQFNSKKYNESIKTLNKHLKSSQNTLQITDVFNEIGDSYGALGNKLKACEYYTKSVELGDETLYDTSKYKACK